MRPKVLLVLITILSITAFSCASTGSQDTDSTAVTDPMTSPSTVDSDTAPLSTDNTAGMDDTAYRHLRPNYPATDMTPGVIGGTYTNNVYTTTGPGVSVSTGTTRANSKD